MNQLRKRLLESPIWNFNQVERDRWVAARASTVPEGSRVLDIGAGTCPYRRDFSHCEYLTQDYCQLPPDLMEYGQIDYVSDATAIPAEDSSFDVIVCFEVLEHVPEPEKVIREMARLLRPGGQVLLSAPLGSGIHQAPFHFYGGFTPYWYERVLTEAGFENILIEPNGGFFKLYGQESIRLTRMTAPWQLTKNPLGRALFAIPWAPVAAFFGVMVPLACRVLDRFDREETMTVGYHVSARKSGEDATAS